MAAKFRETKSYPKLLLVQITRHFDTMGIEPLIAYQKIYLRVFFYQYGCHIYVMMRSVKSEKVLYLALTPDFQNFFEIPFFCL